MGVKSTDEAVSIEPPERSDAKPSPTFSAEVFLLADRDRRSQIDALIPDKLPVRGFGTVESMVEALTGSVALVVVSARLRDRKLEWVVRRTLGTSEHARVVLVAADGTDLLDREVPYDDDFVVPDERDALESAIKHLYVRAYYSATIERYYDVSLSISNYSVRQGIDDGDRETLRRLKGNRSRLRSYIEQFREFLDPEDFEEMMQREHRFHDLGESANRDSDPGVFGLPDSCPDCGLDWTTWHDNKRGAGYAQIGASTWRCTRCGHVLADNDPDNYRVG